MDATGTNVRAAVRRPAETTAWGSSASAVMADMIPILSESMTNTPEFDRSEALAGQAAQDAADIVSWSPGGGVSCELGYEGLEYLFLAAMGFECPTVGTSGIYSRTAPTWAGGSPAFDVFASPNAFVHLFQLDDDLHREVWGTGERAVSSGGAGDPTYWTTADNKVRTVTLAIDKGVPSAYVHLFEECVVNRMVVKASPGKCSVDFDLPCWKKVSNSAANRSAWVRSTNVDRALFPQMRFYVGAAGNTAPTEYAVQEVEITLNNNLAVGDRESGANSLYISEPIRAGNREVSVKVKLARFATDDFLDWIDAGQALALMVEFTGGAIPSSAFAFSYTFVFPYAKLRGAQYPVAGAGPITGDLEFVAHKPPSTYTWVTALRGGITSVYSNEFEMLVCNGRRACFSRDRQTSGVTLP